MHSVQIFDIHSANNFKILQTHGVAWHLDWYLTSKEHSGNHFHYMECVQSNQTLWSKFSATCWIWTSGLTFSISVPLTTNAFRSNYWVSLYKLCNFGLWSESMENPELKWRFICTHKPNSNVQPHGVFRLVWLICQFMWYFQQTHQGYKVKRDDVSSFKIWQQPEFVSMGCVSNMMSEW